MRFLIESFRDESGEKYWVLFTHGKFHKPTAIIGDTEMFAIANRVLGLEQQIEDLGAGVMAYRKLNRMTQDDFAARCSVSRNYISQIERGVAKNLSLDIYQRINKELQP